MAHHQPFKALSPIPWVDVPRDELATFFDKTFADTLTIANSLPTDVSIAATAATAPGRPRAHTESSASKTGLDRSLSYRQTSESLSHAQDLRKEWKEVKLNAKDNPLAINVYKLSSKDGRGSWFARRSLHEDLPFKKWQMGLEREFSETMKVQTGPGGGSIRGIGAEKVVERCVVEKRGKAEVYQLSAQFPGPTAPRDFVTLLLTSDSDTHQIKIDGIKRPLRQFMVVSKPCVHDECPTRQGYIRGQYESVEIIREVPTGKPMKRVRSSIEMNNEEARDILSDSEATTPKKQTPKRRAGTEPNSPDLKGKDTFDSSNDSEDMEIAVEWLMITRSDPGGSVPRFMIEKGTPGGIVTDAGKFLKWLLSIDTEDASSPDINSLSENELLEVKQELERQGHKSDESLPKQPTTESGPANAQHRVRQAQQDNPELVPNSNGLYGMITSAIGAASSVVTTRLPVNPFGQTESQTASDMDTITPRPSTAHMDYDNESVSSDASSVNSFASAVDISQTDEEVTPNSTLADDAASQASDSSSLKASITSGGNRKESQKIEERRQRLQDKIMRIQERMSTKRQAEQEKDAAMIIKLREKHQREIAKHEEKYHREVRRLEEKREAERRKAEDRRRKTAEREDKGRMATELDKAITERDLYRKQMEMLQEQVGQLQKENTMLVAKLGRLGSLGKERSISYTGSVKGGAVRAENDVPANA